MATSMRCVGVRLLSRRFSEKLRTNSLSTSSILSQSNLPTSEYTEEPEYPPIKPKYPPGKWGKITPAKAWKMHEGAEGFLQEKTAKMRLEKLAGGHLDRKPVLYKVKLVDPVPGAAILPFKQHVTKTHTVNEGLPEIYSEIDCSKVFERLRPLFIEAIEYEADYHNRAVEEDFVWSEARYNFGHKLLGRLLNIALGGLSSSTPHLLRSQLDQHVRVATFWKCGGFKNSQHTYAKGVKDYGIGLFQMDHTVNYQIRTELSLPEVLPAEDPVCQLGEVPVFEYSPRAAGLQHKEERPISVSGHWIGDPCEFGHLTAVVANRVYDKKLDAIGDKYLNEDTMSWGIAAGFGSTVAQAHNQGFFYGVDLTYPLVNQVLVTDGQWFRYFVYQLNTLQLWKDNEANPTRNLLWSSPRMPLYDALVDGKVTGFNDNVIKQLLQCLLLEPQERGIDTRPYLPEEAAPVGTRKYINNVGEEPLPFHKPGRFEYPRNAVYF